MFKVDTREINAMPLKALLGIEEKLQDAIKQAKARERGEVREELAKIARNRGFDLAEVLHMRGAKARYGAKRPKYANPENHAQTWTGMGRKPNWLVDKLNRGGKLEEFAI